MPGPFWPITRPWRPETRAWPSAIWAPPCSCTTGIRRMPAGAKISIASMKAEPMMPKMSVTPLATRVSTRASEGVIFCTPATAWRVAGVVWLMEGSCKGGCLKFQKIGIFCSELISSEYRPTRPRRQTMDENRNARLGQKAMIGPMKTVITPPAPQAADGTPKAPDPAGDTPRAPELAGDTPRAPELVGDTPTMRLIGLLEVIAGKDRRYSLQGLVQETGLPKPTLHRMLQQLESTGLLQREGNGRHYGIGTRLRRLAENLLLNDSLHGARHMVLRQLVQEIGESCNLTALSGSEVVYLDRVETAAPLRFYLHPGSRVPVHCSASGKIFLAQMSLAQRRRLLSNAPLEPYTPKTLTDPEALEKEMRRVRKNGFAIDNEEFLPGLLCIAALVPSGDGGPSNLCIAVQAPVMRLDATKAKGLLPALQRATLALSRIAADSAGPAPDA